MCNIFSFLDPKNFSKINVETLSVDVFLNKLSHLLKFDCEASPENLRSKLLNFDNNNYWTNCKKISVTDCVVEDSLFEDIDELSGEKNDNIDVR